MKKLLGIALAVLLSLGAVAASADVDLSAYAADPAEKFSIAWLAGHNSTAIPADDPILQWLNETFNVDLDVWFLERENYEELLTLRIAGGEVPDVFWMENASQFAKYVNQGIVMELPVEVIQQCMPETYAWITEFEPDAFDIVTYEGKNYGLPRVNADGQYNFAPYWRADWLIAAGYEEGTVPMTLAECEEVFYFFREGDPDGNGVQDTYALSDTGMKPVYGAFGALPDRWVEDDDGNLVYGAVYPGMKDALTLLAKWYQDGLIDPEFITGENQGGYWALSVPFDNGQIGFSSSGAYYHLAPDFDGPKNEDTGEGSAFSVGRTLRAFAENVGYDKAIIGFNPVGPDGKQGGESWGVTGGDSIVFSYKLADQPAKVARIMEMLEVLNSDFDAWLTIRNWDLEADKYTYDDLLGYVAIPGHERVAETTHENMFNSLQNPYFTWKYKPANPDWADSLPQFRAGGYEDLLKITTESQPQYWSAMESYRQSTYVQIIRGEQPVDAFDAFVEQWYRMGGEKITQEANDWYQAKK